MVTKKIVDNKSINQKIPVSPNTKKRAGQFYYIDRTKGDNKAIGKTINEAWKDFSILEKISFEAGDKILLKRGEVWNQTLFPPKGGNEKEPIVFDAYGSGLRPVIDLQNRDLVAIRINFSHVSINNIRVQNSKSTAIAISVDGGLKNIKLNRLEIFNAGKNGIAVSKGGTKLEITNCHIENAVNNGINLSGSPENKLSNVIVRDCHIKTVLHNDGITIHPDDEGNSAGSNFLLKNNISEMCHEQGFDIATGTHILLLNNISKNNRQGGIVVGHSAQNITIKGHQSTDEPTAKTAAAINLAGVGNIRLLKSIIQGDGHHLLSIRTNNVAIFNNNFIWDGGGPPIDISGKIENIHFLNNIVHSKQNRMSRIRFLEASRPPNYQSFHFDYNLYYVSNSDVIFYNNNKNYNFKSYQELFNIEKHSINSNPEFVNSQQYKYELKKNSPAIDMGCFYTQPISQGAGNKLIVKNVLFFYKNLNSNDDHQCIMFKGSNDMFNVVDVNYNDNTIFLDKNIKYSPDNEIGICYNQSSLDIGRYEFVNLQQASN